ncbi:LacI family DNA-binding transcriptional regulator [Carnobacterium sp. PL24RED07]|uniref:LacI family DNA-binding transcriptional regulator n=1 Tax=unclassified Carnobacterium TaxID=257487 RepID=UPI000EE8A055|nr:MULTISPECIES: LacI family DNA-binding transcriptional regulator [unclassified Carnobacterium]KAF3303421.1 LacI family DNA-binding transcriptional regulator [Carnobacterium sp. PL26RED25]KAF3306988.1 LacI family DNA-binding transcriptional regulator [Carnobacterium sp. PL24RED07]HCT97642.1 LacI family transcriptional regulator [Aerococcus urinaeequi]
MAITIRDVAKRAGVAPSTVSRVIADNPSISDKTKNKVRTVMKEMNYFPNIYAQGLASAHSKTFGLVLPLASDAFYQNPFFPTVLRGINFEMAKHDYSILLSVGLDDDQRQKHIEKIVNGKQVEGLIFLYASKKDPLLRFAQEVNCPAVVIGSPDNTKVHFVDNDNELIGYQATKSLIQQGCDRIAYIGGDMNQFFIADRHKGYKRALESAGIIYDPSLIYNDINFLPSDGYELAQHKIDFSQIDGLVISDELVAEGIRNYLDTQDIQDVHLITFSAYRQGNAQSMNKTSYVNLNSHIIGSRAVDILFEALDPDQASTRFIHEYVDADLHTT